MSRPIRKNRGQFVIIAALLIAALTLAAAISIHEINIHRQSITYRPVDTLLLGTTSDMNRALTVALANYTYSIRNGNLTEAEANFNASRFMATWKKSVLTSYSSYGITINPDCDMTPRFEIGPWSGNTPWNGSSTFSFAYIPYGLDVDSYGFKGWVGATVKYVQLKIFSETVETNWTTGLSSLKFQLTQSDVNENSSTPIADLSSNPENGAFRIGAFNVTSSYFNVTSPLPLIYLGGGNYSVTFNQKIDPIHKGVRLDLATPKDEIWISAFSYNYSKASSLTSTLLSNALVVLGTDVTDNVTVTGLSGFRAPTGTVRFEYRSELSSSWTAFGNKTLDNGTVLSDSFFPPSAGTWYFRAVYLGDNDYSVSYSGDTEERLTVNEANPNVTTLLSSVNVTLGQSVTDSVTVTGLGGDYPVPTGNVTFQVSTDGGYNWTTFGANKTLSGSSATSDSYTPIAASGDSVSYFFRANYLGDSNYTLKQSNDTAEPLTVGKATPSVSTLLFPPYVTLGDSVTDTATVTGLGGDYPVPTGDVTFEVSTNGGSNWTAFGSVKTLSDGIPTSDSYNASTSDIYHFRARYSGDDNYASTASGQLDEPLTVNKANPTVTTLLSSTNVTLGQSVTDWADLHGLIDFPTPTGTVHFEYRFGMSSTWTAFGSVKTLDGSGHAVSDTYEPFSAGAYYFRAVYDGDNNYTSAVSGPIAEPLTVNVANPTVVTLLSSENVTLGSNVTDSVTVTGLGGDYPVPTGTVTFQFFANGGSDWTAFGSVKTLDGSGHAVSDSHKPSAGDWFFRAVYSGDSNYQGSQSGPTDEPLTVSMGSSATGTSLFPVTIAFGENVTDTATVSGVIGGPTPTGSVAFQVSTDGGLNWTTFGANKTLSGGIAASDSYAPFSAGAYNFRAIYSGDSNYLPSQSGPTDEPLTVSMDSGTLGTYYLSYEASTDYFLTNSSDLPPLDKINPDLSHGHPSMNATSRDPVPSLVTSSTISITYCVSVKSSQTIEARLGFYYQDNYYLIGNASFYAIGVGGNPPPAYYTVSIPVLGNTFVPGFPVQTIPAGSQIVLTTTLLTPKNRVDVYGGMGGTRLVLF
jgi:hypothetical protein